MGRLVRLSRRRALAQKLDGTGVCSQFFFSLDGRLAPMGAQRKQIASLPLDRANNPYYHGGCRPEGLQRIDEGESRRSFPNWLRMDFL